MKSALLISILAVLPLFASFSLRTVSARSPAEWPDDMPRFGDSNAEFSVNLESRGSSFVNFTTRHPPAAALAEARAAFTAAGWTECPLNLPDCAIFVNSTHIAAVLARPSGNSTRVAVACSRKAF